MLKNFISIVLSTAVASLLSISAMAKDVTVNNGNTYIRTEDTLRTSSQYKTVLVVDVNANLSDLEADNIYYIDQALSETEAFVNIGLKRGENSKITEGRYTMYLMGADNNKTTRTIVVSDEPVEGEGVPFSAIAGKNGKNPVREVDGKHYTDQGYTVEFDASDTSIVGYKLKIICVPEDRETAVIYEVPQEKLTSIEGSGTFNLGLQINDIPCAADGTLLATFTPSLIPLY